MNNLRFWPLVPLSPLVPKLCLGTRLSSKLCFAAGATELPGQRHSQTEFGNEDVNKEELFR